MPHITLTEENWFMSYVQVWNNGTFSFGHYISKEHPLLIIEHWNKTHGKKDNYTCVLISFQQVSQTDVDVLSPTIEVK